MKAFHFCLHLPTCQVYNQLIQYEFSEYAKFYVHVWAKISFLHYLKPNLLHQISKSVVVNLKFVMAEFSCYKNYSEQILHQHL